MAVREIKTTLAVDGEKAFNKAVTEAGRNMRVMASEMKAAAADFDLTGDEMEYMGRKSRALNNQIAQQENIIRALEGAVEDSAAAYGDASAKTDSYRIKLNNAQAAMAKLKKELEDSNREMTEMGRDSGRVGRQLETGIGEAAEDASRKVEALVNTMDADLSSIGSAVNFSAFKDGFDFVKEGVTGVIDAITGLVDGTEDYRRKMSFLEANALREGLDPEVIKEMTLEVAALTGDLDGSVEGMSNLMAAGLKGEELAGAVEKLTSAAVMFPDTLKFESLADSMQESIATEQAVGQYAEYLERLGVDLETVNKSFDEAKKKGSEAVETVALAWLSNPDAEKALETYKEMNADMIAGKKAQQELNDEMARTAEILQPYATALTEYKTAFMSMFNEALSGEKTINGRQTADIWWLPKKKTEGEPEKPTFFENLGEDIKDATAGVGAWFEDLYKEAADPSNYKKLDEELKKASQGVADWFENLFTKEDTDKVDEESKTIGQDIAKYLSEGIVEDGKNAIAAAKQLWADIAAELGKTIVGPKISMQGGTSGSSASASTGAQGGGVTLALDGKNVGSTTAPYISTSMGLALARTETYG